METIIIGLVEEEVVIIIKVEVELLELEELVVVEEVEHVLLPQEEQVVEVQ
jgi:hypothetical protein